MRFTRAKKLLSGICIGVLTISLSMNSILAAEISGMTSPVYAVIDANSGKILYSKNENQSVYPASTAKLMTAMVVLDVADKEKKITITENMLGGFTSDVATIGLKAGGTYTVHELLELLLISSAADAAQVLAVSCFGSTEKCLQRMNEKVKELGLTKTHFDNTVGLDIGNNYNQTYTTAAEFAEIARQAMSYEEIRKVVSTVNYTLEARTNNNSITRNTTNLFLRDYYDYPKNLYQIIGTKTGVTQAAGRTLVATATDGEHEVICVTFSNSSQDMMYSSVQKAFTYVFTQNAQNAIDLVEGTYTDRKPSSTSGSKVPNETSKNTSSFVDGNGWKQSSDGSWSYYLEDGSKKVGWLVTDTYEWYYLSTVGKMVTSSWVKSGNDWYYLGSDGKMVVSTTTADGYVVGPDGAWIQN